MSLADVVAEQDENVVADMVAVLDFRYMAPPYPRPAALQDENVVPETTAVLVARYMAPPYAPLYPLPPLA